MLFQKNVYKNMSTKQEIISDAIFKAWPFSSDFNFACKQNQVIATTCKYYCPLVVNLTILVILAKSSILNEATFWDPPLKMLPCTKSIQVSCENQSFFLLFWNVAIFIKVIVFFYVTFYTTTVLFLWIQSMVFQSQNYL